MDCAAHAASPWSGQFVSAWRGNEKNDRSWHLDFFKCESSHSKMASQTKVLWHPKHKFYCRSFAWSNWGPISVLGPLQRFAVVSTTSRIIRDLACKLDKTFFALDAWLPNSFLMPWNWNENQIKIPKPQSEDPSTKLKHVIPIRLFGDGAEAQRISVQPLFFHSLHATWPHLTQIR